MSCLLILSPSNGKEPASAVPVYSINSRLNKIAETYVKLVLAVGQHDSNYVDAYDGPKEWLAAARKKKQPLNSIKETAMKLAEELDSLSSVKEEEMLQLRHQYLKKQLSALIARVEILNGKKMSFDEEAKALYDVVPPTFSDDHFQGLIAELDSIVPGTGIAARAHGKLSQPIHHPPRQA